MLALRYAAVAATALWAGGLLTLGMVVAPSVFETVAARGVGDGRVLGGAIFGDALRRFHPVSYACGGIVLASLLVRGALGPRPKPFALRVATASIMLAAALVSGLYLTGRIERARHEAGGAPSALAKSDPRRLAFDRLHAASTILLMVPVVGGAALLLWESRDQ